MSRAAGFQRGVDDYVAGRHYEAHEHWEELWQDEADDQRRRFLQALIQVASAVHKSRNDVGPRGALRLLDGAAEKLAGIDDVFLGVDVAALRAGMARCRAEIERQLAAGPHCKISADFIPAIRQREPAPAWESRVEPLVPVAARHAWFDRGLAAYAAGDYFDAHELWEELWRDMPASLDRQFLQGLIQVAAAMHKAIAQKKPEPAARLLGRALDKLRQAPAHHFGLDLPRLLDEADRALERLASGQLPAQAPAITLSPG